MNKIYCQLHIPLVYTEPSTCKIFYHQGTIFLIFQSKIKYLYSLSLISQFKKKKKKELKQLEKIGDASNSGS